MPHNRWVAMLGTEMSCATGKVMALVEAVKMSNIMTLPRECANTVACTAWKRGGEHMTTLVGMHA